MNEKKGLFLLSFQPRDDRTYIVYIYLETLQYKLHNRKLTLLENLSSIWTLKIQETVSLTRIREIYIVTKKVMMIFIFKWKDEATSYEILKVRKKINILREMTNWNAIVNLFSGLIKLKITKIWIFNFWNIIFLYYEDERIFF